MMSRSQKEKYVAAIDLGSNSFHMVIAEEVAEGGIRVIDTVREMVRLGAGLDCRGNLSKNAQERALSCLERFQQRLTDIPPHRMRAVATHTLRVANNSAEFLATARHALGHPISVISGHEEARLIYLGAACGLALEKKRRLVIDIGGGSTELIIGQGDQPLKLDSLLIGCVSMTRRFFADGVITKERLNEAKTFVLREIQPTIQTYRECGWDEVVGTSGSIKAINKVARSLGIKADWIAVAGLLAIEKWLKKTGNSERLEHVSMQRRPVFIGGFVILISIYEALDIVRMEVSDGALREGVAQQLIARLHANERLL